MTQMLYIVIDVGNSGAKIGAVRGEDVAGPRRLGEATGRGVRAEAEPLLQGGEGTFVVDHPPALSAAARTRALREAAERFAALAVTVGASRSEADAALEAAWPPRGKRGGRT